MRACIRRLRSLVFALGGRMIDVMVVPIVTLGRERYRTKHNRRREQPFNWGRTKHIWQESQNHTHFTTWLVSDHRKVRFVPATFAVPAAGATP